MAITTEPAVVTPSTLELGTVWVGARAQHVLSVSNPNRMALTVHLTPAAPFSFDAQSVLLPGGESLELVVTFRPDAEGEFEGELTVGASHVRARGTGRAPPSCNTTVACHRSAFDFEAGACRETLEADDTPCVSERSCFATSVCNAGQCVGAQTTCDDGDPCTLDVCGANGCGHVDDSLSCPASTEVCLAPICSPGVGCGMTPVVDGTPCGPRTCSMANVCLEGRCTARPAPQTQMCTEVVAGWPAGPGFVDGAQQNARLLGMWPSMAYSRNGSLYVTDAATIRSVSPSGEVMTIAGKRRELGLINGIGSAARFLLPVLAGSDRSGNLIVAEPHGTALGFRKVSPRGVVRPWVGSACGTSHEGIGTEACLGERSSFVGQVSNGDLFVANKEQIESSTVRVYRVDSLGEVSLVNTLELPETVLYPSYVIGTDERVHICEHKPDGGAWDLAMDGTLTRSACTPRYSYNTWQLMRGGSEVVAGPGSSEDGPIGDAGLSFAHGPFAVDFDGGVAIWDLARSHIRRVENGVIHTLAGPVPRAERVDGRESLLAHEPVSFSSEGGSLYFIDGTALRRFDPDVGVTTVLERPALSCQSVSVLGDRAVMLCNHEVSVFDSLSQPPRTFSRVLGPVDLTRSVLMTADGGVLASAYGLARLEPDDTWRTLSTSAGMTRIKRGITGVVGTDFVRIGRLDDNGETSIIAAFSDPQVMNDFVEDTDGTFVTTQYANTRVCRVYPGTVPLRIDVLLELSDAPTSIALDGDGGLFIGVPNAILRAKVR